MPRDRDDDDDDLDISKRGSRRRRDRDDDDDDRPRRRRGRFEDDDDYDRPIRRAPLSGMDSMFGNTSMVIFIIFSLLCGVVAFIVSLLLFSARTRRQNPSSSSA
jgi:hypothetical protein